MENLFFAPLSSFYRNNLYNELYKKINFTVIYLNKNTNNFRSNDFINNHSRYKKINFFNFNLIDKFFFLKNIIINFKKKRIFVCGWDKLEYWLVILLAFNSKKIFICDSFENKNNKFIFLKKFFLYFIDCVIVPGKLHQNFIKKLNYKKKIFLTKSVGIIENVQNKKLRYKNKDKYKKILYLGRISQEKNLKLLFELIKSFENLRLSIYGKDEINLSLSLDNNLKKKIKFKGSILNKKVKYLVKKYDFLILPSNFEPWGLVIEEAIFNGIPVICSDKVGCYQDLIKNLKVGYVFKNNSLPSLKKSVHKILKTSNLKIIHRNLSLLNYSKFKNEHLNIYEKIMQ